MIKLIIFDWDDVFTLGSIKGYFKCYHEALKSVGVELSPEEEKKRILAKWGKPHREELKELLKENSNLLDDACMAYEEHFFKNTFVNELSLVPGAKKLISRMSKQYTLAIATGTHPDILEKRVFQKFNIPNVFSQIEYSYDIDDPEKMKPHPHMINKILRDQNVDAKQTILVGDSRSEVTMARRSGVHLAVVLTGHLSREEAIGLHVEHVIDTVADIEHILRKL